MSTSTVHVIVSAIGSKAIQARLGVSKHSVAAAKRDRLFPARWYEPLRKLCEDRGIECPVDAFRWIEPKHEGAA